jgi:tyrosyl-tRNA synthetase
VGELPSAEVTSETLVAQALVDSGLTSSLGEARRAIAQGGVYLNNEKITEDSDTVGDRFLAGGFAVLRRGKKAIAGLRTR